MPNLHMPRMGEFHGAYYMKKNKNVEGGFETPIFFRYKATDDEQFNERLVQLQQGSETRLFTLSIYTTEPIQFKAEGRVTLINNDVTLKITRITNHFNSSLSTVNLMFPTAQFNRGVWLHLGE